LNGSLILKGLPEPLGDVTFLTEVLPDFWLVRAGIFRPLSLSRCWTSLLAAPGSKTVTMGCMPVAD